MDDTTNTLEPLRKKQHPVAIGTGLVALDVVIPNGLDVGPHLCAGGTCGNVLTALAFLGWRTYPVARLSADGASKQITADLRQWGVNLDFVTFDQHGSTPVVIQHIRNNKTGEPIHSFSRKCPECGAILPWYKPVRVAEVKLLSSRLPQGQVFFFDRTSPGALSLASHAKNAGAIVFFEPSASSDPSLLEQALDLAHIVKVSSDRLAGNETVLKSSKPSIIIETRGSTGLRLRHPDSERSKVGRTWHSMPPISVKRLRDTAGAGDWCTAGIIHMLGGTGAKGLRNLTLTEVKRAVKVGQAMASWTCRFDGPRGGMYASDRKMFQKSVLELINGSAESDVPLATTVPAQHKREPFACESCTTKQIASVPTRTLRHSKPKSRH